VVQVREEKAQVGDPGGVPPRGVSNATAHLISSCTIMLICTFPSGDFREYSSAFAAEVKRKVEMKVTKNSKNEICANFLKDITVSNYLIK
jgi:hypothetical protein